MEYILNPFGRELTDDLERGGQLKKKLEGD